MCAGQRLEAFSTTFGLLASLAFHASLFAYIASRTADFDFDFDLTLPAEVEFGLTDEMSAPATAPAVASAGARNEAVGEIVEGVGTLDAGVPDPPSEPASEADSEAEVPQAEPETGDDGDRDSDLPIGPSTITGPSRIPPGAQLALRIDVKRIRESPLGPDVTRFLAGIPDWQLLLAGSGIDPVEDLDRLLIASPNLDRSKLVLAGRHRRGRNYAEQRVQQLAEARGRRARWTRRYGVTTAPWHNRDRTRRTIALLSTRHFTITRPQDLSRVLAVAKARELRNQTEEGLVAVRGPDALLSMGPEEAISVEIEGVHRFVRGSVRHVPTRLRVAIRETHQDQATVTAIATYASNDDAEAAAAYWRRVADFYSQQLVMTLAGFGRTLRRMELEPRAERVRVSFTLTADQVRFILSYLEGRLHRVGSTSRPPRIPRAPRDPSTSDDSTTKKGP